MGESHQNGEEALEKKFLRFTQLVEDAYKSNDKFSLSDSESLQLYGVYKVATRGGIPEGKRPSFLSVVARAKYDAWLEAGERYSCKKDAKKAYIDLAGSCLSRTEIILDKVAQFAGVEEEKMKTNVTIVSSPSKKKIGFIQAVVPRGNVDISHSDLFCAAFKCLLPLSLCGKIEGLNTKCSEISLLKHYQSRIESLWIDHMRTSTTDKSIREESALFNGSAVIGSSVRSLFDLFLATRQYKEKSEIVIAPPINIRGMISILIHHNIKIVACDIPAYNTLGVALDKIEELITEKTVAIMIVHPFGRMVSSKLKMQRLSELCKSRSLDLIQDCAECFVGIQEDTMKSNSFDVRSYDKYATVSFYSFGLIKTATALGGGIASFPPSNSNANIILSNRMKSLQQIRQLSHQQTNYHFFSKVVKAFLIKLIASSQFGCGLIVFLCQKLDLDYDKLVSNLIKAFPNDSESSSFDLSMMNDIRRAPSLGLYRLLLRRLESYDRREVENRMERCNTIVALMKEKGILDSSRVELLQSFEDQLNLYWLFPILVNDPKKVSRIMLENGFDVPNGTSQLGCITSFINGNEKASLCCPNATHMMNKILYLPTTSTIFASKSEMIRIVDALHLATSHDPPKGNIHCVATKQGKLKIGILSLASILFICFIHNPNELVHSLVGIGLSIFLCLLFYAVAFVLSIGYVRSKLAPEYLESQAFAKHSGLLNNPRFPCKGASKHIIEGQKNSKNNLACTSSDIFGKLGLLEFPSATAAEQQHPMAFVTGSTGFLGTCLICHLLRNRVSLGITGGIVLLCRKKSRKSAYERIYDHLMNNDIFSFVTKLDFDKYIHVVEGDVTLPNLGLGEDALRDLANYNVTHVFHCASSVSFVQSLDDAAQNIISSSLQMQSLARRGFQTPAKFIYISTAFVHSLHSGDVIYEELFSFNGQNSYCPERLYESMVGTQTLAWKALREFKFPNTYTFAKAICEHLLLRNRASKKDTIVIRPSIIGPSISYPYEGWSGKKPSTIVATAYLYMKYTFGLWCFKDANVPVIPVDIVASFIVQKAFLCFSRISIANESQLDIKDYISDEDIMVVKSFKEHNSEMQSGQEIKVIFNAAWNYDSPKSHAFRWGHFAEGLAQVARIQGHVSSFTAYLTLHISKSASLTNENFKLLHDLLVRAPYDFSIGVLSYFGFTSRATKLKKIGTLLDLPLMFFHFCNNKFNFHSELCAPVEFDGERYMMNCLLAADNFVSQSKVEKGAFEEISVGDNSSSIFVIAGRNHVPLTSDFWWALTQPKGNFFVRILGFILIKVFRWTTTEITVDLESFCPLLHAISRIKESQRCEENVHSPHIVLLPNHRSMFDFLILSFIFFALPEIGIDIPHIAAAELFRNIPILGWLAKKAGAFFVRRGLGKEDPVLKGSVAEIKDAQTSSGCVFEVFLEGKRSRDRRFKAPKTGLLRCLVNTGGEHLLVPLCVSYERIPEQQAFANEIEDESVHDFKLAQLFNWLRRVNQGCVSIGRVHVLASSPMLLSEKNSKNIKSIAYEVQNHQKDMCYVSNYHIDAGACVLNVSPKTIKKACDDLNCRSWHSEVNMAKHSYSSIRIPERKTELWTIFLQFGHAFAPFLHDSHPKWAKWLDSCWDKSNLTTVHIQSEDVKVTIASLSEKFEEAENAVRRTMEHLKSCGFRNPSSSHINQYVKQQSQTIPGILIFAAIDILQDKQGFEAFKMHETKVNTAKTNTITLASCEVKPLFRSTNHHFQDSLTVQENFGGWGHVDSGFVLTEDKSGQKKMKMKGRRYDICGKNISRIFEYLENEMQIKLHPSNITFPEMNNSSNISVDKCILNRLQMEKIVGIFGNDSKRISIEPKDRVRHGTDQTLEDICRIRCGWFQGFRVPDLVVWPKDESEVNNIILAASEEGWCLIPFGGGTNVTHSTRCPTKEEEGRPIISVDMKLMNKVLWVNEEDGTAHVQAGITGCLLIKHMNKLGLSIGHEPDSLEFSTLGGWIATKASGMKRNKYGNIEDVVLHVRVAGSSGIMWQNFCGEKKDEDMLDDSFSRVSTGIDLKSLILGSEGCLGIITSAVIKVWHLPKLKDYDSVLLKNFHKGVDFLRDVNTLTSFKPASIRLVDNVQFRLGQVLKGDNSFFEKLEDDVRKIKGYLYDFSSDSIACVSIVYEGNHDEINLQRNLIRSISLRHGGMLCGQKVGRAGYDLTFVIGYLRDFALSYFIFSESFETFIPWSKLTDAVKQVKNCIFCEHRKRLLPGLPLVSARITQLYDNGVCVYFYFCMTAENVPNANIVFAEIEYAARSMVLASGGSLSHHHGLGKMKSKLRSGQSSYHFKKTMTAMKNAFDPGNVFGANNGLFHNSNKGDGQSL